MRGASDSILGSQHHNRIEAVERHGLMRPMNPAIEVPPPWEAAVTQALATEGVILVLGGPDTGKSTFCRLVLERALACHKPLAFIDGDLGQSHLGPPGTLGLNLYPPQRLDDSGLHPEALYFIGQTSPPGQMLELVVGLSRLARLARSRGRRRLLVNTSGFINGGPARRLKLAKAEALAPRLIIGLERQEELEPILAPLRQFGPRPLTLPVSRRAQMKPLAQRFLFRQERFAAYFAISQPQALPLEGLLWLGFPFGQGPSLAPERLQQVQDMSVARILHAETAAGAVHLLVHGRLTAPETARIQQELGQPKVSWTPWSHLEMRLVGLLDDQLLCLGLGLLLPSPWERRQVLLHTPLPPRLLAQVRFCRLGRLRLDPSGQELPQS